MASSGLQLGERAGPFDCRMDADYVRRYALAIGDPNPLYQDGSVAPPTAIAARIFAAQNAAFTALIPASLRESMTGGVHGEHDVLLHRPIVPGETLQTFVEPHNARSSQNSVRVALRYSTFGEGGEPVAEQWWTTVLLGTTCPAAGPDTPDHSFPDSARGGTAGRYRAHIDLDMPRRYAEVSGDFSAHHFDVEAARLSGQDAVFLHGLCTMALCARAVVETAAGGDPRRVRRVAVRFAAPAFLGRDLDVDLYEIGAGAVVFEATSEEARVITNGRAELGR